MIALSPAVLHFDTHTRDVDAGGEWWRLARTDDGLLCVESISDDTLNRPGPPADWAYGGDVPPHVARQLTDDHDSKLVVDVLNRALRALKYL